MKPTADQITVVTDGVVKVGKPDMESLCTEAQAAEGQASQPGKPIDCRIDNQRVPKHWKHPPGEHIWDTKGSQQLHNNWEHDLT